MFPHGVAESFELSFERIRGVVGAGQAVRRAKDPFVVVEGENWRRFHVRLTKVTR